jgi:hypothetical protein
MTQQYIDKYEGETMKRIRVSAAEYVLQAIDATGSLTPSERNDEGRDKLLEVLNFFDGLGTFVRSGAIEERFVWNAFFPSAQMYWLGAEPLVQKWRTELNRTLYLADAEYLSNTLTDYEKQQSSSTDAQTSGQPSRQKVRAYLQGETEMSI